MYKYTILSKNLKGVEFQSLSEQLIISLTAKVNEKKKGKKRSEKKEEKKSPDRNSTSGVELCFLPVEMRCRDLGTNLLRSAILIYLACMK